MVGLGDEAAYSKFVNQSNGVGDAEELAERSEHPAHGYRRFGVREQTPGHLESRLAARGEHLAWPVGKAARLG
jgi:hypothetical protein